MVTATWAVAALLAVAVVIAGVAGTGRGPSPSQTRAEVVDVSQRFALALGSYDFHHLPQNIAAVKALSTASFQREYDAELQTQAFQQTLVANQSVARASVAIAPLVASVNGAQADTFTVISQTLTAKDIPRPVTRTTRVELALVHTSAGWRVDQADISGS